jgi:hypothetical protein
MSKFGCHHELVESGTSGDVPVYKCRLCGATLRGRKPETRSARLWKHWGLAIGYLGMSSGVFIALALPCITKGGIPESMIQRNGSPALFWGCTLVFVGFSIVTLAVSMAEFRSIWRERKAREHVA